MTETIRILIADDHAVVREGLRNFISVQPEIEIIGEAEDGFQVVELAKRLHPDVILMDLVMPRMNGVEAIREIKRNNPEAIVLVITSFAEDDKVIPAIKAGAAGYLLKDSTPQQLLQAIQNVYHGEMSLHPSIMNQLVRELKKPAKDSSSKEQLTEREIEILEQVARGLPNQEIALKLQISEWTVRTHVSSILTKLQLTNRTQAVLYAIRKGLFKNDQDEA